MSNNGALDPDARIRGHRMKDVRDLKWFFSVGPMATTDINQHVIARLTLTPKP